MGKCPSLLRFRGVLFASVRRWAEFWAEIDQNEGLGKEEAPMEKVNYGGLNGASRTMSQTLTRPATGP